MKLASNRFERLPRKSLLQIGIALAMSATAVGADAAGLGRLNVLSSIGQPLRAEIELTAVSRDETGTLSARLAGADAFAQANIDYGAMLAGLRFSVQRRSNGTPYVLVTSSQLINEPFLDVLVELNWSAGRLVREYTLLIDPPDGRSAQRDVEPGPTIVQAQGPAAITRAAPPVPRRPVAEAAPPVPATPPPARAPATAAGSGGDYVVRNGDTAMSIARDNRVDGVSLDQTLAALYRDNPQAFAGNIDRLRAGVAVKLPDASTARAIDGGEARRIVAQTSNFQAYRERIARNAGEAPVARNGGQQASGRLTTRVDDSATSTGEAKDRLQLSRPDAAARAPAGASATRGAGGGPTVEDLAAKDRELVETKNRLALLEKNVADLQRLVELKNQSLAELQKSPATTAPPAAATQPSTSAPTQPASTSTTPQPVSTSTASQPSSTPTTASPTPAATPAAPPIAVAPSPVAPPAVAPPAPAPVDSSAAAGKTVPAQTKASPAVTAGADESWIDTLKDNALLVLGLLAVLLLVGYGLVTARRRRKLAGFEDSIFVDNSVLHANSVFGTTGGQSVDTANSGFHSNFVPVAGHLPEQSEVDPVAEADVYIAYGRDAQAEEILKEALRGDASRHAVRLKLLEIYGKRGDAKTFETVASELYAATGGQGDDWKQAAALGRGIDPHNPLYDEVVDAPTAAPAATASTPTAKPDGVAPSPASIGTATALGAAGLTGSSIEFHRATEAGAESPDLLRTDPLPRSDAVKATSDPSMDLDFDLGISNVGSGLAAPASEAPSSSPSGAEGSSFGDDPSAKPLVDPFTASAFGATDASARTAVNLPAFRARAAQEAPAPTDRPVRADNDGFTASDIFGSSIVADTEPMYSAEPPNPAAPDPTPAPVPTPVQARTTDFRNVVDSPQFEKTEPLDAFSKINLDLDGSDYAASNPTPDFSVAGADVWQAMATKLDLALAYSDIGDKDGARELLDEVVRSGDPAQADRARQLIGELR